MFLTKFLTCGLVAVVAQSSYSDLFGDCQIDICSSERVEMDITGKFWPRYCYRCPEGEDEVVFLREYMGDGWKYCTSDSAVYEGRMLLSIVPCGEPEVDSMGNYWTSWCYNNQKVNFERIGSRIWIYRQDYAGGYAQLQFRRIINDQVFAQIGEEGSEGESQGEGLGETRGNQGIQIGETYAVIDMGDVEGESVEELAVVVAEAREGISEEGLIGESSEVFQAISNVEESEDTISDIEGNDEISIDSSSELADDGEMIEITKAHRKDSANSTVEDSENEQKPAFKPLIHPEIIEERENAEEVATVPFPEVACRRVEGDKSGRYFFAEYYSSGSPISYELDSNDNFIYDPELKGRISSDFLSSPVEFEGQAVPCKVYNTQGAVIELEPDLYIKNMFWEVVIEAGMPVKFIQASRKVQKSQGMYVIDPDTGYRFRNFI